MVFDFKNMAAVLGQAGAIRDRFKQLQDELGGKTVEAEAGAGAVRVVVNGKLEVVRVQVDRPLIRSLAGEGTEADVQMVEDLIMAATNAALAKAQQLVQQEITKVTGGVNIPGLERLLSGGS